MLIKNRNMSSHKLSTFCHTDAQKKFAKLLELGQRSASERHKNSQALKPNALIKVHITGKGKHLNQETVGIIQNKLQIMEDPTSHSRFLMQPLH